MRYRLKTWTVVICLVSLFACENRPGENLETSEPTKAGLLHDLFHGLSEAIIFDGFPPPVASRIYAYCAVTAYSSITSQDSDYVSLQGQLASLDFLPTPDPGKEINPNLVLISSFVTVGKSFVYRDFILDSLASELKHKYIQEDLPENVASNSEEYAKALSYHIVEWSKTDFYRETRNYELHSVNSQPSSWQPTKPSYGSAIEPHWGKIRTFVIDSFTRDACQDHVPFSAEVGSEFYNQLVQIRDLVSKADSQKIEVALFWDCNPVRTERVGRIALVRRQLTPGGHWMGIVRTVCLQADSDITESADAYLRCSLAIADGFISAWKTKFETDLIRPETYIKRYIDSEWNPILETPLFPEHPSAHSTISSAAATVLTPIFGNTITYVDSVNMRFGPKPRTFNSLLQAADEAGVSRLYGGIHYQKAIDAGSNLGVEIGNYLNVNLKTKKPI
jgi:hypothetical protein